MRIGIVVAMEKEFAPIVNELKGTDSRAEGHFSYAWGTLGQHSVAVILGGIGKVHAALATAMLIYHARPDCILSIGCSGALRNDLNVGDIISATQVAYHDVWCGEGNSYGQVQGCPPRFACHNAISLKLANNSQVKGNGLLVSGECFIPSKEMLQQLNSHFSDAIAIDMESAAVAQTCWIEGYPFAALRIVSDTPGAEGCTPTEQYQRFWENHPENAFRRLMNIVEKL